MARLPLPQSQNIKILDEKYLIGDEIGKGAYGRVNKGVDLKNGDFVAIKQVSLENIPNEDLSSIMSEIELLKNLKHRNVVKYLGSVKSKTHLCIILEFVENGSLASIVKPNKFGPLPETLVAIYIAQILEGLAYLHEQGIIHRDIKGANILTTKEGTVKLADFGVATKLNEADDNALSVVGTPYWMAPEVIEMSGVTPSADIWSVGCTAIELLTGSPPFYDLQPMSALFRIVKDDMPPLPEQLSPDLRSFLHLCFQKDPKLRPDAVTLQRHPWVVQVIRSQSAPCATAPSNPAPVHSPERVIPPELIAETTEMYKLPDTIAKQSVPWKFLDSTTVTDVASSQSGNTKEFRTNYALARLGDRRVDVQRFTELEEKRLSDTSAASKNSSHLASQSSQEVEVQSRHASNDVSELLLQYADSEEDMAVSDMFSALSSEVSSGSGSHRQSVSVAAHLRAQLDRRREEAYKEERKNQEMAVEEEQLMDAKFQSADTEFDIEMEESTSGVSQDAYTKESLEAARLLSDLHVDQVEEMVLTACKRLSLLLSDWPEPARQEVLHNLRQRSVVVLMDMMDALNPNVLLAVMKLMLQIMKDSDVEFQESLCMAGIIPSLLSLVSTERSRPDIRLQSAEIIRQLCRSTSTLQTLISCRGLPVLVGLVEPDVSKLRPLAYVALDCFSSVFFPSRLENKTSSQLASISANRAQFCCQLAKSGLILRLINMMHTLCGVSEEGVGSRGLPWKDHLETSQHASPNRVEDSPILGSLDLRRNYLDMAASVLVAMARAVDDECVWTQFCAQSVLKRLLGLLDSYAYSGVGRQHLSHMSGHSQLGFVVKVLQCLKQLAMDPNFLEPLQKADVMKKIVPMLAMKEGPFVNQIHSQVLSILYNLCKVSKKRQELAGEAGAIPLLLHLATSSNSISPTSYLSPLRQFAIPLLCDMSHASRSTRDLLWQHNILEAFYLGTLLRQGSEDSRSWGPQAVEALVVCLCAHDSQEQRGRVEQLLLRRDSLEKLVAFFGACSGPGFVKILEPYLKMMTKSVRLNAALGVSGLIPLVVARLDHQDAIARLNLLKIIKAVYENHPRPKQLLVEHDLPRKLQKLTEERRDGERTGGQILVKQMASTLLRGLRD